jgi:aminomethyltransferase
VSVGTAFYPREAQINRKLAWGEWSGYFAAACYADFHDIEYNAVREAAALFDVSPLYKYIVSGRDAQRLLDRIITRDVRKLAVDQVIYTPWCDERGKVIDDGTVTRLAESAYRVTAADPSYRWFSLNATGLDVEIEDVSETLAGLALQGKLSRDVLEAATGADWHDVAYFRRRPGRIGDVDVDVTRTGYTGDRGYELWIDAEGALAVWDALFEAGEPFGIRPAGIRALDVARVEAGLILIEADYASARHAMNEEQEYSPFEIGLGRLVNFAGAEFVGKRALQAEVASGGPARRLVGLEIDWSGIEGLFAKHGLPPEVSSLVDRSDIPLYRDGRRIGKATSTAWGPTIKKMISLASVEKRYEAPGSHLSIEWSVEGERGKVAAIVVPLPFLDLERKRN